MLVITAVNDIIPGFAHQDFTPSHMDFIGSKVHTKIAAAG